MSRTFLRIALIAVATAAIASVAEARQTATVMAGDPMGRNVLFSFVDHQVPGKASLRITTHRVGNPGAKLSIWIDRSKTQLFSRILTDRDCKFSADGAQCSITIPGNTRTFQHFLIAFERGRSAHVEVRNAAVMQMQTDVSLTGVARDLKD